MNILCNQKKLAQAITNAQKAINNKTNIELLRGILLTAKEDRLIITGYDSEISIETSIEAQVNQTGSIVVNSRLVGDIIRKLPDTMVSIEVDTEYNVTVNCVNSRFKIKGIPADEFPRQPEVESSKMANFSQKEMKEMIRQTVFATAVESINPTLSGELFEIKDKKATMVAVDGYRLAIRKSDLLKESDPISAIIPGSTLNHLNSLLSDEGEFLIGVDSKNIIFNLENTKIVARLIDGNFTNYEQLLPSDFSTKVIVDRRKLQNSIERAALLFTGGKNNLIKLAVTDKMMAITSNNENGNAYEELKIDFNGENQEVAFNSKYFLEAIKNLDCEKVSIELGGSLNPCIIKPVDSFEYIYLLLPVRLGN